VTSQIRNSFQFHFATLLMVVLKKFLWISSLFLESQVCSTIAEVILHRLSLWEFTLINLRGQCYDGNFNIAGARSGCKALILEQTPMSLYTHCAAHQLHLAVAAACSIQSFKNAESFIGEMARFFKFPAKWQALLDKAMDATISAPKAKKLKDACHAPWIQ